MLSTPSTLMGTILRQGSVLLSGNILLLIGSYFFKIYLARTVGAEGLGLFAIADSLLSFALLAIVWQLPSALFRFIPQFTGKQRSSIASGASFGQRFGIRWFWASSVGYSSS